VRVPTLSLLALFIAIALLGGCATPSRPGGMTAQGVSVSHRSAEALSIVVTGGKSTSATGMPQISDADFREALKQSILKAGLFNQVVEDQGGHYRLEAYIGSLSQPMFGFSFTVEMEVSYRLVDLSNNSTVWQKTIKSSHTATTSDSIVAVTRLQLANEGAAKKNIESAIGDMDALALR
jgi:hypothetical protein